jgi:hypothetical protein
MPHIVVGDPSQREARISGNVMTEKYLGVLVTEAPDELAPGGTAEVAMVLMYWPEEKYESVVRDATFTLREGPKVVGFGRVVSERMWRSLPLRGLLHPSME